MIINYGLVWKKAEHELPLKGSAQGICIGGFKGPPKRRRVFKLNEGLRCIPVSHMRVSGPLKSKDQGFMSKNYAEHPLLGGSHPFPINDNPGLINPWLNNRGCPLLVGFITFWREHPPNNGTSLLILGQHYPPPPPRFFAYAARRCA